MAAPSTLLSAALALQLPSPLALGIFYCASEIFPGVTRRSGSGSVSRDRRSLPLLWAVIIVSLSFAIQMLSVYPRARLPHQLICYVLGMTLFAGGIVLRWYSIFYLGRFFTVDVSIAREHKIIDTGPYRFIRHPSYTGALIAFLGFGLFVGNRLALLCVIMPITAAFLWRIRVEERALSDALGDNYRTYMQRTKRLIPFVY